MYQKIIIIGNLGRDPEMRYMADGRAVTGFSVATNRSWNDRSSGERHDETTWFRVSVFGRQAETANEYLKKGRRVLVEGRLRIDDQTGGPQLFTRQDGTVGANFEIIADNVRFLGGREDSGGYDEGDDFGGGATPSEEEEIPF